MVMVMMMMMMKAHSMIPVGGGLRLFWNNCYRRTHFSFRHSPVFRAYASAIDDSHLPKRSSIKIEWKKLETSGNVPSPRSSHTVCFGSNLTYRNSVIVYGGEDLPRHPFDNNIYSLDLTTNKWQIVRPSTSNTVLPILLLGHTFASIGHLFYVFGGRDAETNDKNTLYTFDTQIGKWFLPKTNGKVPLPRSYHSSTVVGKRIFIFGGCSGKSRLNDLHSFNTETNTWEEHSTTPPKKAPSCRGGPSLTGFRINDVFDQTDNLEDDNALLLLFGGFDGKEKGDLHAFNTKTGTWEEWTDQVKGDIPSPRSVLASTELGRNKAFIFGGERDPSSIGHLGAGKFYRDSYVFDVKTRVWTKVSDDDQVDNSTNKLVQQPTPRGWLSAAGSMDKVVLFGGLDETNTRLADVYVGHLVVE